MHCKNGPPKLYDLAVGPPENKNLTQIPDFQEVAKHLADEVAGRWDGETLGQKTIAAQ